MYTEYHTLVGDMEFSKNMHALKLYSGILGAFLSNPESQKLIMAYSRIMYCCTVA
jgi:hypothetical protein